MDKTCRATVYVQGYPTGKEEVMLPAEEYKRIYMTHGKEAADAEFDRQMRGENIKLAACCVILVILVALMFLL